MTTLARLAFIPLLGILFAVHVASADDEIDPPALSDGEIRQLLAPIALYPDALLSQILIASTYPLEVVEAARWVRDNPGLEGQAAVEAVEDRDWDLSIQSLVAFPEVIERMSVELDWTRRLGDAFLLQEDDVLAAVQDLRERAEAAGTLDGLEHASARREGDVIVIESREPRIVYVPYYRPQVVYGGWWWPGYPPYYWHAPGVVTTAGFYWGSGIVISSGFYFSHFDWRHRHIVIRNPYRHHFRHKEPRWRHDPYHRRGVVYRQPALNRQFGRSASSPTQTQQKSEPHSALQRHHGAWGSRDDSDRPSTVRRTGSSRDSGSGRRAGERTHLPQRESGLRRSSGSRTQRGPDSPAAARSSSSSPSSSREHVRPRGPALQRSTERRTGSATQRRSVRDSGGSSRRDATTRSSSRSSDSRSSRSPGSRRSSSSSHGGPRSSGGGGGGSSRGSALGR